MSKLDDSMENLLTEIEEYSKRLEEENKKIKLMNARTQQIPLCVIAIVN